MKERCRKLGWRTSYLKGFFDGLFERNGRGERIRTSDPLVPNQVRYQTALRPELAAKSHSICQA
jgi:hypothetical protein